MKRLTIFFAAIVIALVIAVVALNQSANAHTGQPFKQDPLEQAPETPTSKTQHSKTQVEQTKTLFPQGAETQGSSLSGSSSSETVPFEKKFWRYLSANNYKNWAPVPGQSGDFTAGQQPHGKLIKMFLNRTAAGNVNALPAGSIIVNENYSEDKSLQSITVMYKNAGYNPGSGDWYWVKYNPDGSVPFAPPEAGSMKLAGRVKACIECHAGAGGSDFTFFND